MGAKQAEPWLPEPPSSTLGAGDAAGVAPQRPRRERSFPGQPPSRTPGPAAPPAAPVPAAHLRRAQQQQQQEEAQGRAARTHAAGYGAAGVRLGSAGLGPAPQNPVPAPADAESSACQAGPSAGGLRAQVRKEEASSDPPPSGRGRCCLARGPFWGGVMEGAGPMGRGLAVRAGPQRPPGVPARHLSAPLRGGRSGARASHTRSAQLLGFSS